MNTSKWTSALDEITQRFARQFSGLSPEQLNWKPDPKTWSIAQVMDHIITVNESYYPIVRAIRNGSYKLPFIGGVGFMVRMLGNAILAGVQPAQKRKTKTFPIWQPSLSSLPHDILSRFQKHQEEMKAFIESCSDLLDAGAVISSPANRLIVYKLEKAFDIIIAHERRHLEQAKAVKELKQFPAA